MRIKWANAYKYLPQCLAQNNKLFKLKFLTQKALYDLSHAPHNLSRLICLELFSVSVGFALLYSCASLRSLALPPRIFFSFPSLPPYLTPTPDLTLSNSYFFFKMQLNSHFTCKTSLDSALCPSLLLSHLKDITRVFFSTCNLVSAL